jgi:hypothetical protein
VLDTKRNKVVTVSVSILLIFYLDRKTIANIKNCKKRKNNNATDYPVGIIDSTTESLLNIMQDT